MFNGLSIQHPFLLVSSLLYYVLFVFRRVLGGCDFLSVDNGQLFISHVAW